VKRSDKYVYADATREVVLRNEWETYSWSDEGYFVLRDKTEEIFESRKSEYIEGKTVNYAVMQTRYKYDEYGSEISYTSHEYKYTGNGCECIEIYTDQNGNMHRLEHIERHVSGEDIFELKDPNGSCEDGLIVTHMCPLCGYKHSSGYWGNEHVTSQTNSLNEKHLFADYGHTCGGRVEVNACPCGERVEISYNYDADYLKGYEKEIDGVVHYFEEHRCHGDCGQYFTIESWNEKDAECNAMVFTRFTFAEGSGFTVNRYEEKYHQTYDERVEEECTYEKYGDGSCSVQDVYVNKCRDCGSVISKRVHKHGYDSLGRETASDEYHYVVTDWDTKDM
jgi:hypothetical protein